MMISGGPMALAEASLVTSERSIVAALRDPYYGKEASYASLQMSQAFKGTVANVSSDPLEAATRDYLMSRAELSSLFMLRVVRLSKLRRGDRIGLGERLHDYWCWVRTIVPWLLPW